MAQFFECLHCGLETPLLDAPAKCPQCGHGTGIIVSKDAPARDAPRTRDEADREAESAPPVSALPSTP